MYRGKSIILIVPAFNEDTKIGEVIRRVPRKIVDKVTVVDDGSTDCTAIIAERVGADQVIRLDCSRGVGYAIRAGYRVAQNEGYDISVTIAGNNKDNPQEIPVLLDPICDERTDFVMGSRFLSEKNNVGEMPRYRIFATRIHPILVSIFCGHKITESTNGFRALRTSILYDQRLRLDESWLDRYELEVYLLMKILKLGYRTTEVPVSKIYPPKNTGYTKMSPIVDWWRMLAPIFLVGLGFRS